MMSFFLLSIFLRLLDELLFCVNSQGSAMFMFLLID